MLTSDRERAICAKYSERQADGKVRCNECPLVKDALNFLCKANSTYNRSTREWELDDGEEARHEE